ncbi:MAG: MBL fold metallo-hydrolase [Bauldia sp.]|nr:MBL fold metallo-hydrolase [Bauldia sp.]
MRITFHGAARGVTGSCHLIECAGKRLLVDCVLFQGGRELAEDNAEPFGFDAASIDFVLLTHAHLDHCGRLPLLARRGFRGEIVTTSASRELARLVMLDSARLQEEDAERNRRRRARRRGGNDGDEPLYTVLDAMNVLEFFGRSARYDVPLDIAPGIRATFFDAGHILGSASIFLELTEAGRTVRLTMSGDIGNAGRPLLDPPEPPPASDVVVMESTYGDRDHRPFAPSIEEFYAAVEDTFRRGGNVVIPTFALERAQELLFCLHDAVVMTGRLQRSIQVFLDSPMAISATEIFRHQRECLSDAVAAMFRDHDPFSVPGLHFTRETAESMRINTISGGAVIMAGSGMATGGRIRHHLKHNLWRADAGIVFVGFAAEGTLARAIINGAGTVRIFGEEIPVKARIYTIGGFSAHADQAELVAWHRRSEARRTYLVHGEESAMAALQPLLGGAVDMPRLGDSFDL